jgi:hypothetical protein
MKTPMLTVIDPTATGSDPPRKLGANGLVLWRNVQHGYVIEDAAGVEMLLQCCEAADTCAALQAEIERDGTIIRTGRRGPPRDHPGLKHLLGARAFIVRTLQKLGLDAEAVRPHSGRPPGPSFGT